jgi:hypothetical protein
MTAGWVITLPSCQVEAKQLASVWTASGFSCGFHKLTQLSHKYKHSRWLVHFKYLEDQGRTYHIVNKQARILKVLQAPDNGIL